MAATATEVPRWEVRTLINSHGYFVRGIDLAKNVFAIHAVDEHGKAVLVRASVQRTWRRLLRVGDIFALLASRKVVQA